MTTHGIGTLNEKPLHAELKRALARPGDRAEVPVDGFTVDLVRGELLIEIQTRNLSAIRRKLGNLVERHPVRLLYPIVRENFIVRQSAGGRRTLGRRRSPVRGAMQSLFEEFVSVAALMSHPNFSLEVALVVAEEVRRCARGRCRARKGWTVVERRLVRIVDRRLFETPEDLLALVPEEVPELFTTLDLSEATGQPAWLAQKMAYSLRVMGAVAVEGKMGRHVLYRRPPPARP
jgi:hypothetical protein